MISVDNDTLAQYLKAFAPFTYSGTKRHSSLTEALKACRQATKRDPITGIHNTKLSCGYEGNWLGCIGYFTVLDQMGSCFRPKGTAPIKKTENRIEYAIRNFAYALIENDNGKLQAIKSLRNAFTHDFNLLNIPKSDSKTALEQHRFTVTIDTSNPLWIVKLPETRWDGNIEFKNFSSTNDVTTINLFGIAELTETVYKSICKLCDDDKIETDISIKSLINKYSFITD